MLRCKNEGDKFILEASISNQGNKSIIVSRIWLLSPFKGSTRIKYECESINQSAPLKVQPLSSEFQQLSFPAPDDIKLHGMYPKMERDPSTYELLFFVTDDRGTEHYAKMPVVRLAPNGGGLESLRNTVRLVPGIKNSQ